MNKSDVKLSLSILIEITNNSRTEKLRTITLSVKCDTTGQTGDFVQFVREHHTIDTIDNIRHNFSSVIISDNYMRKVIA